MENGVLKKMSYQAMSFEDDDDSSLTAEQYLGKVISWNLLHIFCCLKNCNLQPPSYIGCPRKVKDAGWGMILGDKTIAKQHTVFRQLSSGQEGWSLPVLPPLTQEFLKDLLPFHCHENSIMYETCQTNFFLSLLAKSFTLTVKG